jgi:hypothetical protein
MSKQEVIPAAIAERIERIKEYHTKSGTAFGDHMGYAFLAGCELRALRDESTHGNKDAEKSFKALRQSFFPEISQSSAYRYMTFAEALQEKIPTVGIFKSETPLLTNGELPEQDRNAVLKAVHEVADGKTITALYRDLGVIREKKAPEHHPRKEKKLTAAEELELRAKLRAEAWGSIELKLAAYGIDFVHESDLVVDAQIAALEKFASVRRQWRNTPQAKRNVKATAKYLKG